MTSTLFSAPQLRPPPLTSTQPVLLSREKTTLLGLPVLPSWKNFSAGSLEPSAVTAVRPLS
ncbi:MAG: hypothetical protein JRI55_31585 [Deltaproteobacteria bacterium]|nr:hypothetical protein [Deltaproteobacteria bacterium]